MNIKSKIKIFVMAAVLLGLTVAVLVKEDGNRTHVQYTEFLNKLNEGTILSAVLSDSAIINFENIDGNKFYTDNPRNPELKEILLLQNVNVTEVGYISIMGILQGGIGILFFVGAFYIMFRIYNKNDNKRGMEFSAETVSGEKVITFSEIAGNEEAKESALDIVDFIKHADKYAKYGARMPRGIIFYGRPGTGKTLMAKAIAGEAGVPFYSVSGSDFVQMYVGVGASRIRELFKKAREAEKCVIFIDEIDALGKKRSREAVGGNDERDQTLNALLTEMSGFNSKEGIVVIAATNRLDILDDALLRPGRFDRQIEIGLPDLNARKRILELYMKDKPIHEEVSIDRIAKQTVYFSGAMLENLLNEAALASAKSGEEYITQQKIDKAYDTIIAGSEKKDRSNIKEQDREITAYHEAGHGLISKIVSPDYSVSKISIIPTTKGAGGFCVSIPPDKMYYTKKELESKIMVNLAGRVAEEITFGKDYVTTGAANDIEQATSLIKDYVTKYGMSEQTGILYMGLFDEKDDIYKECSIHIERLYKETKRILLENHEKLKLIAQNLLENETLQEDELEDLIRT